MAEMKKLEISFEGEVCEQDIWDELDYAEWCYLFGLRETAKITCSSIAYVYEE